MLNAVKDAAALGGPFLLAALPLIVVFHASPPLTDSPPQAPHRLFGGWRITITIARAQG